MEMPRRGKTSAENDLEKISETILRMFNSSIERLIPNTTNVNGVVVKNYEGNIKLTINQENNAVNYISPSVIYTGPIPRY